MQNIKSIIAFCIGLVIGAGITFSGFWFYIKKSESEYSQNIRSTNDRLIELSKELERSQNRIDSQQIILDAIGQHNTIATDRIDASSKYLEDAINRCKEIREQLDSGISKK